MRLRRLMVLVFVSSSVAIGATGTASKVEAVTSTIDIIGPVGSGRFGERLTVLPNGNYIVGDSMFDSATQPDVGAVYLYEGGTNQLISTLRGSSANDRIGSGGFSRVGESNFVVRSPNWSNGAATNAGAVTWVNGVTGLNGVVSPLNSLVGSTLNDTVGNGFVLLSTNNNYVITSAGWDNGATVDAGAVTWSSGTAGSSGAINASNSFVGTTLNDSNGLGVTTIASGNYVVRMPGWDNGAIADVGSATFASGMAPITGSPSASRSLVGTSAADGVGSGVTALTGNNNYVVRSPLWNNGAIADVGAATWASGTTGIVGPVSVGNSLVGAIAGDGVGTGVNSLSNGHYVVRSPNWDNAAIVDAGAVTWRNGTMNGAGTVSAANSLVGSTATDQVGSAVTVLTGNGNYLVRAPLWNNGAIADAGSVTFANGAGPTSAVVSAVNSLVGTHPNDQVGLIGTLALPNGNYGVFSPVWNNGPILQAGANTWGNGTTGTVGAVSVANSYIGSTAGDQLGGSGGGNSLISNYVFLSPSWDNGATVNVGAVTLVKATGGSGAVGPANSIVGSTANDSVGSFSFVFSTNGNFLVGSPFWDNGALADAGALTWGSGVTGSPGVVSPANSIVGLRAGDALGSAAVTSLTDGNFVASSPVWDNGAIVDAGAATWLSGTVPTTGSITAGNSIVGTTAADNIANGGALGLADGDYVVRSTLWNNGAIADAGAVTYGDVGGTAGTVMATNSVRGGLAAGGAAMAVNSIYTGSGAILVGRVAENIVTLLIPPFKPNFASLAAPARLADTRPGGPTVDGLGSGGGPLAAGATLEVVVAGRGGVAANAIAAGLNVTSVEGAAFGFVTVFPCGEPRPGASSLNFTAGSVVPNAVFSKIGDDGKVCVFVSQPTHIVVDVNGYFPPSSSFESANPARLVDTRPGEPTADGLQQGGGPVGHDSVIEVQVGGRAGVPASASTAVLNITITQPILPGFATVFPCGEARPTASSLNYVAGLTVANLVVSKIGAGGKVCVYVQTSTHVIVDVTGFFPARTSYSALNPARLLDTRANQVTIDGQFNGIGFQLNGATVTLKVTGRGGVPDNAHTVMLNVTVTGATVGGFITVFPCGIGLPLASSVNYAVDQTVANAVITKVGTGGNVCLFTSQPTHLVVDVTGFIAA